MTATDQSPPVSRAFMSRLREVLTARLPQGPGWVVWVDGVVEELAGATPPQGIDRGDVAQVLAEVRHEGLSIFDGTDRILALVRPVEGVVLSREEAELAAPALRNAAARHAAASGAAWHALAADLRALASRLEVS